MSNMSQVTDILLFFNEQKRVKILHEIKKKHVADAKADLVATGYQKNYHAR